MSADFQAIRAWMKTGAHLPPFMRDFHDQKDLFKTMSSHYNLSDKAKDEHVFEGYNWILFHILVIDYFLRFMAQHGYTLQKTRKKGMEFFDVHQTIRESREAEVKAFAEYMVERAASTQGASTQ